MPLARLRAAVERHGDPGLFGRVKVGRQFDVPDFLAFVEVERAVHDQTLSRSAGQIERKGPRAGQLVVRGPRAMPIPAARLEVQRAEPLTATEQPEIGRLLVPEHQSPDVRGRHGQHRSVTRREFEV